MKVDELNQDVIAPVTLRETEFGRLWVVGVCPFCSYRHIHSAGYLWDDPQDWLGPRNRVETRFDSDPGSLDLCVRQALAGAL